MPSLRELRRKVKTIRSTQQITKAMKMMSAARLRRAQNRILGARPFALKMQELVDDLLLQLTTPSDNDSPDSRYQHPLLTMRRGARSRGLLLVTADKGLCGSFNTSLIRNAIEFIRENKDRKITLFCVGRKGRDFFRRAGYSVKNEYINIFTKLSFAHAELLGRDLMDFYGNPDVQDITVIYNEFKSVMQQRLVRETLLPLSLHTNPNQARPAVGFIYEPRRDLLLEALFPRTVKAQIFRILLESAAAELGARMTAMENATRNAAEMIESVTLYMNKIRQGTITKEISELIAGAEALQ
ncbi:MAG TPA: ATP synthase F1 subunit gamma [Elusimicrobiota bacterium]|nr:ATP synthase F1 subunit gamma [Elusimicrobiota bacterium]